MIFEITGIRFQMKGATKDEQTTKAEQFIDSLTFPCKIRLMREMDNIYSSHAIAVYRGYKKVGYVSENNTIDLLEACECGQLSKPLIARITGLAGHLSLTGQVEVPEHSSQKHNRARVLVSSPFHITIPFLEEDHQLHLLAHMILTENYNADNICSFIECLRDYTQMHAVSVCDCDCSYLGKILYKVKEIITENPSLPHFTLLRLKVYEKRLQELVSQVHSVGEMLQFSRIGLRGSESFIPQASKASTSSMMSSTSRCHSPLLPKIGKGRAGKAEGMVEPLAKWHIRSARCRQGVCRGETTLLASEPAGNV